MDIRRLQKIKGGSFTLSLPKGWVEKRRLESGEQIAVIEEEDGSLRVFPVSSAAEKLFEVTLSLDDYRSLRALEYVIGTYYIQGSHKISITSKETISAEDKHRLKLLRIELPGMEVAEEKSDRLSFQVLIDPSIFSLESLIEKTASFSLHLQEDAVQSMVESDYKLAAEVMERSREALRHYRMTIRQVALASLSKTLAKKVGVRSCQECITFALVARDLNRLVYHSTSIANHVSTLKEKKDFSKEILDTVAGISQVICKMQEKAVQAFLKKDVKLAISVMGRMKEMREREKMLLKTVIGEIKDVDTAVAVSMIARDLRRIAGYAVAIADDAMNRILTPKP
jgi:phosphate uptake regulator